MLILTALLVPAVLVLVIALAGALPARTRGQVRRTAAMLAPGAVLPAVVLAISAPGASVSLPWVLFGTVLTVDVIARPLLLIGALLYGAALMMVAWLKVRDADRQTGALTAFLLTCFAGNMGAYIAADAVSFYLFFAVMSFAAAGLVIHYRNPEAHRATGIYLVMSVLSETAILAALILIVHAGGMQIAQAPAAVADSPHTGLITGLVIFGFGVKAGTVPLHVWLPLAHPAAPPAASAVLSGAMVKAGMIGWLRFLPLGQPDPSTAGGPGVIEVLGWVMLILALVGAFALVIVGSLQQDPKVILAYSTISQMGFIGAVVAAGLLEPGLARQVAAAAVVYAVHHGLAKGALFLGVPVAKHYGSGGIGVLVLIGMVGAGLAVAGAPLTSGAFGKYVSKEAVAPISVLGVGLDSVLPLVATGSTLLLMRFAWVMWREPREPRRGLDGELVSWLCVVAAGITVPWWVGAAWTPVPVPAWEPVDVWNAVWPIGLGLVLGALVWVLARRDALPSWIPPADGSGVAPGDLVVPEERALAVLFRTGERGLDAVHRAAGRVGDALGQGWSSAGTRGRDLIAAAEAKLAPWQASGWMLVLLLAATCAVLLVIGGMSS